MRAELADLPAEVVEELTGGLEADLAELAAESSTPLLDRLGSPRAYADELRSSAGLPDRSGLLPGPPARGVWQRAADGLQEDRERILGSLRARPWWPGAVDRGAQLRPAWWLLRGAVGGWLVGGVLGASGLLSLLLVLAAAAVSVEVGRRRWTEHWQRVLLTAGNALAVVVLPFAAYAATNPQPVSVDTSYVNSGPDTSRGVWSDGQVVTNIYPYDAQGRPLTGVQLLDDYGRPLATTTGSGADWSGQEPSSLVPAVAVDGALRWNAYPLRAQAGTAGAVPTTPPLPEQALPPLLGAGAGAASPLPTPTPTEVPSLDASATSTPPAPEPTPTVQP